MDINKPAKPKQELWQKLQILQPHKQLKQTSEVRTKVVCFPQSMAVHELVDSFQ